MIRRHCRRSLRAAVVALALLTVTACSGKDQVGDESLLQFDQQEQGDAFAVSTTVPSAETTAPPVTAAPTGGGAVATTATTLPPAQQEVTLEVNINGGSPYFDPGVVTVLVGGKVRFINRDTEVHSVLSDTGAFDSGPIQPGGVFVYDATTRGQFNYSDGTRPFAVGLIEVQ